MKFKPLYFYGAVFIIVVAILIIISQQSGETTNNSGEDLSKQEMPNDQIHSPLKSDNAPKIGFPLGPGIRFLFWVTRNFIYLKIYFFIKFDLG